MKILAALLLISIVPAAAVAQKDTPTWETPAKEVYAHAGPWAANGLAMVCKKMSGPNHCGCIDTAGHESVPFIYEMDYACFFEGTTVFNGVNRMVAAKRLIDNVSGSINENFVYGIINEKGETVLPFEYGTDYRTMHPLDAYHVFYTKTEPRKYGAVDSLGNVIIPFEYDAIEKAGERIFVVQKNKQYGLLDNNGQALFSLGSFSKILYNFFFRVLFIEQNKQWGVYSLAGKEILPIQYYSVNFMVDGYYLFAETKNSINFFTPSGKLLKTIATDYPLKTTDAKSQTTFPLVLIQNKKYGVINAGLQMSIPFEYDFLSSPWHLPHPYPFSPIIYHVKKRGKEAYIDSNNRLLSSMWFDTIVFDGQGVVKKDGLYGWVNGQGKLQIPVKYKTLRPIRKSLRYIPVNQKNEYFFIVTQNGRTGLLDYNNKWVLPYDKALQEVLYIYQPDSSETLVIICKKNGKYGAFKAGGEIIVPFEYDKVEADFYSSMIKYDGHFLFTKGGNSFTVNWETFEMIKK